MYNPNLPQYSFGSWLGSNAGTIGMIGGAALGTLIAPGVGTQMGASIGGAVGGAAQSNYEGEQASQDQMAQLTKQRKLTAAYQSLQNPDPNLQGTQDFQNGGSLGVNGSGQGDLENYSGQTHNGPQGGIPVGPSGSPASITGEQPVGLVEDNENAWTDPESGEVYIFSDKLKDGKDSFADLARKINKKYYG